MAGRKIYLVLAGVSLVGIFAAMGFFVMKMVSDDFFGEDTTVFDILTTVFLYLGLMMLSACLMAFSITRYFKTNDGRTRGPLTKRCVSCGHEIGIMDLSCSRCFVLQPPEDRSGHIFRKR